MYDAKLEKEAKISAFSFFSNIDIKSNKMRENELFEQYDYNFDIKIEFSPKSENFKPNSKESNNIQIKLKKLTPKISKMLEKEKITITDENKRKATYNIEKEIKSIKPTIYLTDEGIKVDPTTGQPDFEQIKTFCNNLLIEVQNEFFKNIKIYETNKQFKRFN